MEKKTESGTCIHCSTTVNYPISYAGRVVNCQSCGSKIVIGLNFQIVSDNDVFHNVGPKTPIIKPYRKISNVLFYSTQHCRYNMGQWDAQVPTKSLRVIKIRRDKEYSNSYIVTIFQPGFVHPVFGDNLSMSPKRMEVVLSSPNEEKIQLQGYGSDPKLSRRPPQIQKNYAICLQFNMSNLVAISLFILDRKVEILYFQEPKKPLSNRIQNFFLKLFG